MEFDHVWFAYKDEDWVLSDVSFRIEPGETIAVVGHTGAGKTTISSLLLRFYEVQRGAIRIGGIDIREFRSRRPAPQLRSGFTGPASVHRHHCRKHPPRHRRHFR